MALEKALKDAARMTWRHRWWWLLGLLAAAGGLASNLGLRGASSYALNRLSLSDLSLSDLTGQELLERFMAPEVLAGGLALLFLLGLVVWLVGAVAEGGLITAVAGQGSAVSGDTTASGLGQALRAGLGLLGRFVGIDTLLFLPLFLLVLALLATALGGLIALVAVATRPTAEAVDLYLVAGLTVAISIPLLLAMLVSGLIVILLRPLAFRAAALDGQSATGSIKRAWQVLRSAPLAVVALAVLLMAIRSAAGLPVRLGSLFLAGLGSAQLVRDLAGTGPDAGSASLVLALGGLLLAFVSWLVGGIMSAYGSAAWTLAYQGWRAGRAEGS